MITIQEIKTLEQIAQVQVLEEKIWQTTPIPSHQTQTAIKNGGIIVGAYDDDALIGFSYGFPGFKNGKVYLCSHMLGIDEQYRSQKIGEQLKKAQREIAIAKGYDLMIWTFDPLETRNGYLNLSKLNGICDTYVDNCYGELQDGFNKGLPSDRFEVHWYLNSPYVEEQHEPNISNAIPVAKWNENNELSIQLPEQFTANAYMLPVPKNFQQIKRVSQEQAIYWRFTVRVICRKLMDAGYAAVRLQQLEQYNAYIFVKKQSLNLGDN